MLDGKVVAVTGAGRGIGRAHALTLAELGASVVVNDLGTALRGGGRDRSPALETVSAIIAAGGRAMADHSDVASWAGSRQVIDTALKAYGRLDGLVNNAGVLRAAPIDEITEADLDTLVGTHLRGTYGATRHACAHWRERSRSGEIVRASVVNTVSEAMLVALPRYAVYSGMKAAVATLTLTLSLEGSEYGVRANAYAPRAATRMMPGFDDLPEAPEPTISDPANSSPLVAWLLSDAAEHVSGQVFQTVGGAVAVCSPWTADELLWPPDGLARFDPHTIGDVLEPHLGGGRFSAPGLITPPGWPQPES